MKGNQRILLIAASFGLLGVAAARQLVSPADGDGKSTTPGVHESGSKDGTTAPLLSNFGRMRGDTGRGDDKMDGGEGLGRFGRDPTLRNAIDLIGQGREIFRYDTFGDEALWGDTLRLHEGIAAVSPRTALAAGLKVDVEALPRSVRRGILTGTIDLDDPATTQTLLELNAVVGVTGFFDDQDRLTSVGIQCALCHSSVDDSLAPGVGKRLDGWANRDLDVGAIINLSPDLQPLADRLGVPEQTVRDVLSSWGPGKFDASLQLDAKALRDDGQSAAVLIPPAFGLAGVNLHTWTGWGGISHWNALVATLEMGGKGTFLDSRLKDASQFPIAAQNGSGEIRNDPDLVTSKLPALQLYQLSLPVPTAPEGSFDSVAAGRGEEVFNTKADCASCHVAPLFTEPGWNLHRPEEIGIDDFQANRSPARGYRTSPLRGLWTHQVGGFYHDGRFPTLEKLIDHYDTIFTLGLTGEEKRDLVEYLKSL